MKTLIISLEYPPQVGGIATHVFEEAKFLGPENVIVLTQTDTNGKEFDLQFPWKVIRKKLLFNWLWPKWIRLFFVVRKIVKTEVVNRIIVHHALPVGYVARLIKFFYKIPYLVFFHGTDLNLARKKFRRLKFATKKADHWYVNSEFLGRRVDELLGGNVKTSIIYPCPDDNFFEPEDKARTAMLKRELGLDGKVVMLTVARLADGKGYPQLARLMPKILEKVPNLVWLIVGTGPKEGWFMEFVKKNELVGTIRFVGPVPYIQLPDLYKLSNLFVLLTHPDLDQNEAWGVVFMEAAASNVPVVAGRAGGVEEAVIAGRTGLVVDTYNEEEVVSAIVSLVNDSSLSNKLRFEAKKRAMENFRWSKQLEKM